MNQHWVEGSWLIGYFSGPFKLTSLVVYHFPLNNWGEDSTSTLIPSLPTPKRGGVGEENNLLTNIQRTIYSNYCDGPFKVMAFKMPISFSWSSCLFYVIDLTSAHSTEHFFFLNMLSPLLPWILYGRVWNFSLIRISDIIVSSLLFLGVKMVWVVRIFFLQIFSPRDIKLVGLARYQTIQTGTGLDSS